MTALLIALTVVSLVVAILAVIFACYFATEAFGSREALAFATEDRVRQASQLGMVRGARAIARNDNDLGEVIDIATQREQPSRNEK